MKRDPILSVVLLLAIIVLTLESGVTTAVELQPVAGGLSSPIHVTNAGDGSNRLFIVEQPGRIKVLQLGATVPTIFLDIVGRVLSGGEQGLLGLAFHPQFIANRRFFVNYTRQTDGATVVAEHQASASDPNIAETAETVLLTIPQPFANHNGGMLAFGPDGYLYIGTGDGGSGNDPGNRAQNIDDLLGKILRIDVDHPDGTVPYSSPLTNPYFGPAPGRDEIYAIGLRNPWRFSFDRGTGQLFCADVGQNAREEVDIITLGGNFGWRVFEGTLCTGNDPSMCPMLPAIPPIIEYDHSLGRCSITGGYVYRGLIGTLPTGSYVYADFCTGEIFVHFGGSSRLLLDSTRNISSFGEDEAGEIYVVGLSGTVDRIIPGVSSGGRNPIVDYDGDGKTDVAVWTPRTGLWNIINSSDGNITMTAYGGLDDVPVPGDFDGDGKTDIAVWRPSDGIWYIINSSDGGNSFPQLGSPNDIPAPGDYDGDGKTDAAVWTPATGLWTILSSSDGTITFAQYGGLNDVPVPGDYDGDGKTDIAIWRPSVGMWFITNSSDESHTFVPMGVLGDVPISE